jgi:hypothetical protein
VNVWHQVAITIAALAPALGCAQAIENSALRLEVSPANGSITRLLDKRSRTEYITNAKIARLFELLIPNTANASRRIVSWKQHGVSVKAEGVRLTIRYPQLQPDEEQYSFGSGVMHVAEPVLDIEAVVTLTLQEDHIEASLRLTNRSLVTITGVAFPSVAGLAQSEQSPSAVVVPSLSQRVYTNTTGALSAQKVLRYPAMIASSWLNFQIPAQENAAAHSLGLEVRSGLESQDAYFSLTEGPFRQGSAYRVQYEYPFISWIHYPHLAAHEAWTSPPTILHVHATDWHGIATEHREWYRETAHPKASRLRLEANGIATYQLKDDDNNIAWKYTQLSKLAADAQKAGMRHIVVDGWREREGPSNPAPFGERADDRMGGTAALRGAIDELHRRDIELLFTFHPTLINVTQGKIPPEIGLWGVKTRRGGNQLPVDFLYHTFDYPEALDAAMYRVEIDPASQATPMLLGEAQRIKKEYGFRNLLLKGLGQQAFLSYNGQHGVEPQKVYERGVVRLLDGLRSTFGDGLLIAEGANDLVSPLTDGAYTWDQMRDGEVLAYSLPWLAFTQDVEALDYASANGAFVLGMLPNLIVDGGSSSVGNYPEFAAHLRRLGELRSAAAPYYRDAEFRDHEGLSDVKNDEGVVVASYLNAGSNQRGIVIANLTDRKGDARFRIDGLSRARNARILPAGPKQVTVEASTALPLEPHEVLLIALDAAPSACFFASARVPPRADSSASLAR